MRSNLGGGDCRAPLQVGGAGEGNLPRTHLIRFSEYETASFLLGIRSNIGKLTDDTTEAIWEKALLEHARPFCPCAASEVQSAKRAQQRSIGKHKSTFPRAKFAFKVTKPKPPNSLVVPRLQDIKSLRNILECWRNGKYINERTGIQREIYPLFDLNTAEKRSKMLPGSNDKWWKSSGNKAAYARIRRKIQQIASHQKSIANIYEKGSDEDWESAMKAHEAKLQFELRIKETNSVEKP